MVRRASLDNFVHNGIVSRRFEFITLSRRCSYYYLIGVLLKEEIFISTEGRNRRVENLIFDRAGLFERCENLFLRKKVEKRGKEKKTGSTRKTTLIVGTHKSSFHVRWLHTRRYESDIDHPV